MTKRHKHAKKSKAKPTHKKGVQTPKQKRARTKFEKVIKKTPSKRRVSHPKKSRRKTKLLQLVSKKRVVSKQRIPKPIRNNKRPHKPVKRARPNPSHRKGKVRAGKGITKSKSKLRSFHEQAISKREVTGKKSPEFTEKITLKTSKEFRHDKEGRRIKEKNIPGYRQYFRIDLPKGTFEQHIDHIRNGNFTFLNAGLHRNKPLKGAGSKEPRAVIITLETAYKSKRFYSRGISEISFIVRKNNVKKLILERMIEYQDNWLERADEDDSYLDESGKAFAPKNITGINIEFVY